jgi:hypothetical protein
LRLKSPEQFDRDLRELLNFAPWCSVTSTRRSKIRNEAVGGSPLSKHLLGMAADLVSESPSSTGLEQAMAYAAQLDFWAVIHVEGDSRHLHIQGLPPGEPDPVWLEMFG